MANSNILFVRNIDPRLKRQFKAKCARDGVSMSEAITILLKFAIGSEVIQNHKPPAQPIPPHPKMLEEMVKDYVPPPTS